MPHTCVLPKKKNPHNPSHLSVVEWTVLAALATLNNETKMKRRKKNKVRIMLLNMKPF